MAKSKTNIEYYSHDADMHNDPRLKLARNKYGLIGYAAFPLILEFLSAQNCLVVKFDDQHIEEMSVDLLLEIDELTQIIKFYIDRDLLQVKEGYLYCRALDARSGDVFRKRQLNLDELRANSGIFSKNGQKDYGDIPRNSDAERRGKTRKDAERIIPRNSDAYKVKKSKEKKSKERREEGEKISPSDSKAARLPSPRTLLEIYDQENFKLPKVLSFTKNREEKCRSRIRAHARSPDEFLSQFRKAIQQSQQQPFMYGDNDRSWSANFDWFIANDTNYVKVLEGKFKPKTIEHEGVVY